MLSSLFHMTLKEDTFGEKKKKVLTNNLAELIKEHLPGLFTSGKSSFLSVKFKPQVHGYMTPSPTVFNALP